MERYFQFLLENQAQELSKTYLYVLFTSRNTAFADFFAISLRNSAYTRNCFKALAFARKDGIRVDLRRSIAKAVVAHCSAAFKLRPSALIEDQEVAVAIRFAVGAELLEQLDNKEVSFTTLFIRLATTPNEQYLELFKYVVLLFLESTDRAVLYLAVLIDYLLLLLPDGLAEMKCESKMMVKIQWMLAQQFEMRIAALVLFFRAVVVCRPTRSNYMVVLNAIEQMTKDYDCGGAFELNRGVNNSSIMRDFLALGDKSYSLLDAYLANVTFTLEHFSQIKGADSIMVTQNNVATICESVMSVARTANFNPERQAAFYKLMLHRYWSAFYKFAAYLCQAQSSCSVMMQLAAALSAVGPNLSSGRLQAIIDGYQQLAAILLRRWTKALTDGSAGFSFEQFYKSMTNHDYTQTKEVEDGVVVLLRGIMSFCHQYNIELQPGNTQRYISLLIDFYCGGICNRSNDLADKFVVELVTQSAIIRRTAIRLYLEKFCSCVLQSEKAQYRADADTASWHACCFQLCKSLRVSLVLENSVYFLAARADRIGTDVQLATLLASLCLVDMPHFDEFVQNVLFCFEVLSKVWDLDSENTGASLPSHSEIVCTTLNVYESTPIAKVVHQIIAECRAHVYLPHNFVFQTSCPQSFSQLFPGLIFRGISRDKEISLNQKYFWNFYSYEPDPAGPGSDEKYAYTVMQFVGEIASVLNWRQAEPVCSLFAATMRPVCENAAKSLWWKCQIILAAMPLRQHGQAKQLSFWTEVVQTSYTDEWRHLHDGVEAVAGNSIMDAFRIAAYLKPKAVEANVYLIALRYASVKELCAEYKTVYENALELLPSIEDPTASCEICFAIVDSIGLIGDHTIIQQDIVYNIAVKIIINLLSRCGLENAEYLGYSGFDQILFYDTVRFSYIELLSIGAQIEAQADGAVRKCPEFRLRQRYQQILLAQDHAPSLYDSEAVECQCGLWRYAIALEKLTDLAELIRLPFKLLLVILARLLNHVSEVLRIGAQSFCERHVLGRIVYFMALLMELYPSSSTYFAVLRLLNQVASQSPIFYEENYIALLATQFHRAATVIYVNNPYIFTSDLRVKYLAGDADFQSGISILIRHHHILSSLSSHDPNQLLGLLASSPAIEKAVISFREMSKGIFDELISPSVQLSRKGDDDKLQRAFFSQQGLDAAVLANIGERLRNRATANRNDAFRMICRFLEAYYCMDTISCKRFVHVFAAYVGEANFYALLVAYCLYNRLDLAQFMADARTMLRPALLLDSLLQAMRASLRSQGQFEECSRMLESFLSLFSPPADKQNASAKVTLICALTLYRDNSKLRYFCSFFFTQSEAVEWILHDVFCQEVREDWLMLLLLQLLNSDPDERYEAEFQRLPDEPAFQPATMLFHLFYLTHNDAVTELKSLGGRRELDCVLMWYFGRQRCGSDISQLVFAQFQGYCNDAKTSLILEEINLNFAEFENVTVVLPVLYRVLASYNLQNRQFVAYILMRHIDSPIIQQFSQANLLTLFQLSVYCGQYIKCILEMLYPDVSPEQTLCAAFRELAKSTKFADPLLLSVLRQGGEGAGSQESAICCAILARYQQSFAVQECYFEAIGVLIRAGIVRADDAFRALMVLMKQLQPTQQQTLQRYLFSYLQAGAIGSSADI